MGLALTTPPSSDGPIDYQVRHHDVDFVLSPYYGTANLSFITAQNTLKLKYKSMLLYKDDNGVPTSGLNPLSIRTGNLALPVARADYQRLCLDPEGIVLNEDGSYDSSTLSRSLWP